MNNGFFKKLLPHIIAVVIFLIFALIFCSPSLGGKVINQSDIVHWKGMAQQSFLFKEQYGHFPLWTNSMFGGMPAYQIAMESGNVITPGIFHKIFMLFLPKPIGYFFLICVGFYFLTQVFKVKPWIGILGALGYGYASFNAIIIAVGHDTQFLALAYVPALLGALILLYEKKYWLGGALTALFSALLIAMNHLQISYYFFIVASLMSVGYIYQWIKEKEYKHLVMALGIALVAGITGILSNATNMFVTYDYSKATMRNGTGLDTTGVGQEKKTGLPIDYAFNWSYGKTETFTLLFPGIYGGSNGSELKSGSHVAKALEDKGVPQEQAEQFAQNMGYTYWGDQPFTSGPVYLGAIMCFLFIFGMVYLKTWHKWWMLAAVVLAIFMSWGKNFAGFNTFLFNYLPLYNKFRAPTMSLVIPQLIFPLTAVLVVQRFLLGIDSTQEKWKNLKLAIFITGGILLIGVFLYIGVLDYKGANDGAVKQQFSQALQNEQAGTDVYNALKADRQSLYGSDLLRSIILIALAAGILVLYVRNKIKFAFAIGGLLLLNAYDLVGVGKRYFNENSYVEPDQYDQAFVPTAADQEISKDKGYYRVLNLTTDIFNDAITSYHHNSVGGYHPAKLSIVEDLLNFQLRKQQPNRAVLNMLNTKYIIVPNPQTGQPVAQQNPEALGAAWFVKNVRFEKGGLAVMNALNNFNPKEEAIVDEADKNGINNTTSDSTATIQLLENKNDEATYQSNNSSTGFGVFSEIFYDRGWKAYIDGKETPIIKTDYVLRGLVIPAGQHKIRFEFKPQSFYTGEKVSMIAGIVIWLLLILAAFQVYRANRKPVITHG